MAQGCCQTTAQFLCVLLAHVGLLLSFYALHVEKMKEANPKYSPLCDVSKEISCSRVFSSRYGTGFGMIGEQLGKRHWLNQPNGVYGIVFYSIMSLLSLADGSSMLVKLQTLLSLVSLAGSAYLFYVLFYILHEVCVVCISSYAINIALFLLCLCRCCCSSYSSSVSHLSSKSQSAKSGQHKKRAKRD